MPAPQPLTYDAAGVATAGGPLAGLLGWVNQTLAFRPDVGRALLGIGYYANVLRLTDTLGLAISTDGVGTKILVAEMLGKYDTLGIDCIAMNVNDVLCVGAEPIAMVDYLAVQEARPEVLTAIGKGLYEGARQANISIPGGELAQLRDMIQGHTPGGGIDLMGTCVGVVQTDRMILGDRMVPGDAVIGLASSGVHSNGFTLARRALFDQAGLGVESRVTQLGRTVGEELLEPTRIYVRPVWEMIQSGLPVHGLYHITGDGLLNLTRGESPLGFEITALPEPQPIFRLIAEAGAVAPAEMYRVFNMGIGFVVVAPADAVDGLTAIASRHGLESWLLGRVTADPRKRVELRPLGLVGEDDAFMPA